MSFRHHVARLKLAEYRVRTCWVNLTCYTFSGADVHSIFVLSFDAVLSDIRSVWYRLTKMPMPKPGRFWNKVTQFDKGNAPVLAMLRYRIEMQDPRMPIPTAMASQRYPWLLQCTQLCSILLDPNVGNGI
jgi:hypothetical protein